MRIPLALLAGVLICTKPLFAVEQGPISRLPSTNNLFQAQPKAQQRPPAPAVPFSAARQSRVPTVVCGMTMIPADPNVDADIRRPAPERPKAVIHTVQPATCQNKQAR